VLAGDAVLQDVGSVEVQSVAVTVCMPLARPHVANVVDACPLATATGVSATSLNWKATNAAVDVAVKVTSPAVPVTARSVGVEVGGSASGSSVAAYPAALRRADIARRRDVADDAAPPAPRPASSCSIAARLAVPEPGCAASAAGAGTATAQSTAPAETAAVRRQDVAKTGRCIGFPPRAAYQRTPS